MPLFGGTRTDVEIALDRDTVVAGEEVVASLDVGELDKKVQAVRVELGYRNTYKEDDTDADGDRTTSTTREDVVVHGEQLPLESGTPTVTLFVPPDAPGSAPDSVDWFVKAVVDRKRARDASAQTPLTVLAPLEPLAAWAERAPEVEGRCLMELSASSRVVRPGETITGTLRISAQEEISARAVRVQLRRRRDDPDRNTDEDDKTRIELGGQASLAPGQQHALDFSIQVPGDAAPSFRAQHNEQHWYLEGIIDVKRSSDPTIRLEILVVTA